MADTRCTVILRTVERGGGPGGCFTGSHSGVNQECCYLWEWEGTVDVDTGAHRDLLGVHVLYRTNTSGGSWYQVAASPQGWVGPSTARYAFRIAEHTPSTCTPPSEISSATIDLIPYARITAGRLFDHNVISDPLGTYDLSTSNQWKLDQSSACGLETPAARWVFSYPGFEEQVESGPITAGGTVTIVYDGRRLRETQSCMGAEGAARATTIRVRYMFDGKPESLGEEVVEAYVESYRGVDRQTREPEIKIPDRATTLAVWFYCQPGFSQGAEANWKYDSNQGANYVEAIAH
jgi:hypothetical protein